MSDQKSAEAWQAMLVAQSRLMWGNEQTHAIHSAIVKAAKHLSVLMDVALDARRSTPYGLGALSATDGRES